jgi:putative aldouronate transport system substrate-binding protein
MPGFKDGVKLMNQWYNEKLIHQDFPLVTVAEDGNNILKSGVAGAFAGNWDLPFRTDYNINAELARNVPGASFIAVDLNLSGKAVMDKTGLYMFIPTFSKSQKEALQYLNWLSKFENLNYLQIGDRGRNHNMVDGVPQILATPTDPRWIQNSTQNIDITMPINGVWLSSDDAENAKVMALSYQGTPQATVVSAYQISVKDGRAPVVHPAILRINQYTQVLNDKADAVIAQAIRASVAQFETTWTTGYNDWWSSGAKEVFDERTSQWPR